MVHLMACSLAWVRPQLNFYVHDQHVGWCRLEYSLTVCNQDDVAATPHACHCYPLLLILSVGLPFYFATLIDKCLSALQPLGRHQLSDRGFAMSAGPLPFVSCLTLLKDSTQITAICAAVSTPRRQTQITATCAIVRRPHRQSSNHCKLCHSQVCEPPMICSTLSVAHAC